MKQTSRERVTEALKSVVAVPVTPFTPSGEVDELAYLDQVGKLSQAGVRAVTVNGNTGEFYSLSQAERRRLVHLTVRAANGMLVIAGVGTDSATAAADAADAQTAGAHCVMVHQPIHPFRSLAGWVEYHGQIADASSHTYLIPYVRDPGIDAPTFAALADRCPDLVGVKYAVRDPAQFAELVAQLPHLDLTWICGLAELWAPFFAAGGATGFTSGLVMVNPTRSLRMMDAIRRGDTTAVLGEWHGIWQFEDLRARNGSQNNVSVVKHALSYLGRCYPIVRPPISQLSSTDAEEVAKIMKEWDLPRSSKDEG
jgi:4-hydroxy-tetrahydrodipicolinate synthase